jgi:hypothetical protein
MEASPLRKQASHLLASSDVARIGQRRIRLVVESGSHFVPPPGTTVVGGTVRRDGTELVLVVADSLPLEQMLASVEGSVRKPR